MAPGKESSLLTSRWIVTPHFPLDYRGPVDRAYTPFPEVSLGRPILDLLHDVVIRHPMRTAFDGAEGPTSFAALWRAVCRLTQLIVDHPVDSGPIGVLVRASVSYGAAVFACLAAGRICVPLDAEYPEKRNADIASVANIGLVIGASKSAETWPGVSVISLNGAFDEHRPVPVLRTEAMGQDQPAFILCTSGSTGRPKAIVHSQRTMLHWVRSITNALHITSDDRVMSLSSLSSLGGFSALLTVPLTGATTQSVSIAAGGFRDLMEILARESVSILRASPSLLRNLAVLPGVAASLAGLRIVQTYGEPLLKSDLELLRTCLPEACLVRTTYGATEASGLSWFADPSDDHDITRVAAGILMPETEAMIVNDVGQACAPGDAGELVIRSRYNALGEWEEGRLVAGRLTPDPSDQSIRIYHTGDVARWSADGVFVVLGRKDRMVKVNGQRVEPVEIEAALCHSPEVAQAAVVAHQNGTDAVILAFVVPNSQAKPRLQERLHMELRVALPTFMLPAKIILLECVPLLPGGKRDEAALLAMTE